MTRKYTLSEGAQNRAPGQLFRQWTWLEQYRQITPAAPEEAFVAPVLRHQMMGFLGDCRTAVIKRDGEQLDALLAQLDQCVAQLSFVLTGRKLP